MGTILLKCFTAKGWVLAGDSDRIFHICILYKETFSGKLEVKSLTIQTFYLTIIS